MKRNNAGMTIVELMVTMAIIVMVMGLTIGGVLKANAAAKAKRVAVAREAFKAGIMAFRHHYGIWPGVQKGEQGDQDGMKTFAGQQNAEVLFALEPLDTANNPDKKTFVDPAVIFARTGGGRIASLKALRDGSSKITPDTTPAAVIRNPADPPRNNSDNDRFFKVNYNLNNDSVTVD